MVASSVAIEMDHPDCENWKSMLLPCALSRALETSYGPPRPCPCVAGGPSCTSPSGAVGSNTKELL